MAQTLLVLVAAFIVCLAPGIQGTSHLSFANDTQEVNITRDGCNVTKVCVDLPSGCDPAGNGTCLFTSLNASTPVVPNDTNLTAELRGDSTGYVALGLTANASEGTSMLFICAQNNGSFFFRTMQRNNSDNSLTPTERIVTEIRGMVNDNVIKCEFTVPNVNATAHRTTADIAFTVLLGTGTTNGTMLGPFNTNLTRPGVALTDPVSTMTTMAPTTVNGTTMSGTSGVQPHVVLLLLSIVTLSAMLRA